ncbi:MAG: DUF2987 domain-containing protein, partial [Psychromonas sp.]
STLFGYMKTMYKLDLAHVTTAFYLVDKNTGDACLIKNADMVVDNKREPVKIGLNARLLPFYSDQHRKDGAKIEVELQSEQASYQCDLQIMAMAKESELKLLSYAKLALISEELEAVLKKNAGMVGKYFLPSFTGVRVTLKQPLSEVQRSALPTSVRISEKGELLIPNTLLVNAPENQRLDLAVTRITPWLTN